MLSAPTRYDTAILEAHRYLLENHDDVIVLGQGVWSPWYVGNTMKDLDLEFGRDRVRDTPVSEQACTGVAVGAALCGYRTLVTHPRVDFALLAIDQIVNQAAKWSLMFGGRMRPAITVRCIINRGGEQGAQHSQSLHSWFAHIPGLRVVIPATPLDARDLLIASVLSDDPVVYIDDRWLYDLEGQLPPVKELDIADQSPVALLEGTDITLVGAGHTTRLCMEAAAELSAAGISCEVLDLRVLNPLKVKPILDSIRKTRRLGVVDGDWRTCGMAGEILAVAMESCEPGTLLSNPFRLTLPDAPAPTSKPLEAVYYVKAADICNAVRESLSQT